jgi:hypothetical protein
MAHREYRTEQGPGTMWQRHRPPVCWLIAFLSAKVLCFLIGMWAMKITIKLELFLILSYYSLNTSHFLMHFSVKKNASHFFTSQTSLYPSRSRYNVNSTERHSWLSRVEGNSIWTLITLHCEYLHILLFYQIVSMLRAWYVGTQSIC